MGAVTPFDYIEYKIEDEDFRIYYGDSDNHKLGFQQRESLKTGKKSRSDFKTNIVKSSTTEQIDANKYNDDEKDDFTNIKQLLVDLSSQDKGNLRKWMRQILMKKR